ncbi:hypothetical protein ACHAXA_006355 [Cyclostephanos tholiformis]|uniref:Fe2OG dioxygenase domain-containing protein n=1 Tax=Cyclostephanos tholiformis TaxID=382380 RepID=A0ABD3RB45_9STRA
MSTSSSSSPPFPHDEDGVDGHQCNDDDDDGRRLSLLPRVDHDETIIVGETKWLRLETLSYLVESHDDDDDDDDEDDDAPPPVLPPSHDAAGPLSPPRARGNVAMRRWDRVVRTTKRSESSIDAVLILAVLRNRRRRYDDDDDDEEDLLVLVRQYRPAVDMDVLELPAGLIDDDENAHEAALRELKEETGYLGTNVASDEIPILLGTYLSPGLTNECACLVRVDVDMNRPENRRVFDAHRVDNENTSSNGIGAANCDYMETDEIERMMTTVLLPMTNVRNSIHEYLAWEGERVGGRIKCGIFTGLYNLAVGMDMGNAIKMKTTRSSSTTTTAKNEKEVEVEVEVEEEGGGGDEGGASSSSTVDDAATAAISNEDEKLSSSLSADDFPLVILEFEGNENEEEVIHRRPTSATSQAVTSALRSSGFLLVKTDLLPLELQRRTLRATRRYLTNRRHVERGRVISHPTDPKAYAMIEGMNSLLEYDEYDDDDDVDDRLVGDTEETIMPSMMMHDLEEWYRAMRETRNALLRCISVGLGMDDDDDIDVLVRLHDEDNDSLRLLEYSRGDATTGNRCKEHSDYGTLTLLLNDGISGLEAYVDDDDEVGGGSWRPVPYVEGCIVVNVGSILSKWTGGALRATLHRVAGPASVGVRGGRGGAYAESLLRGVSVPRYSIAYFADPNGDVIIDADELVVGDDDAIRGKFQMSVLDYIRWRSYGGGSDRSGVAFTSMEKSRLANVR